MALTVKLVVISAIVAISQGITETGDAATHTDVGKLSSHNASSSGIFDVHRECFSDWLSIVHDSKEKTSKFWDSWDHLDPKRLRGLELGARMFLGRPQECATIHARPFAVQVPKFPKCRPRLLHMTYRDPDGNSSQTNGTLQYAVGVCMPEECSDEEVRFMLPYSDFVPAGAEISSVYSQNPRYGHDAGYYLSFTVFTCLVQVVFICTCVHGVLYIKVGHQVTKEADSQNQFSIQDEEQLELLRSEWHRDGFIEMKKKHSWIEPCLCFSIFANVKSMFEPREKKNGWEWIPCIDGLRVLSMCWGILGNLMFDLLPLTDNPLVVRTRSNSFMFQGVVNATLASDSFFLISGLVTVYTTLHKIKAISNSEQGSTWTRCAKFWFKFFSKRYLKWFPALVFTILGTLGVYSIVGWNYDTPIWQPHVVNSFCNENPNWVWTLIYINNFVQWKERCLQWTWFLSVLMQFMLITPLLVGLLHKKRKLGILVTWCLILSSCVINLILTATYKLPPGLLRIPETIQYEWAPHSWPQNSEVYAQMYYSPFSQFMSFGVGVLLGDLFFRRRVLRMGTAVAAALWLVAIALGLLAVYGRWPYVRHEDAGSNDYAPVYNATYRLFWALSVGTLIVQCHYGNGKPVNDLLSSHLFVPLARTCFVVFLLYPCVMNAYIRGMETTYHFTTSNFVLTYFGMVTVAFGLSGIAALFIQIPFAKLMHFNL